MSAGADQDPVPALRLRPRTTVRHFSTGSGICQAPAPQPAEKEYSATTPRPGRMKIPATQVGNDQGRWLVAGGLARRRRCRRGPAPPGRRSLDPAGLQVRQDRRIGAALGVADIVSVLRTFAEICALWTYCSEFSFERKIRGLPRNAGQSRISSYGQQGNIPLRVVMSLGIGATGALRVTPFRGPRAGAVWRSWNRRWPQVAGHAADQLYGMMGIAARKSATDGMFTLGPARTCIERLRDPAPSPRGYRAVDFYVVVQYGTRIQEVAHNLQETVKFDSSARSQVP